MKRLVGLLLILCLVTPAYGENVYISRTGGGKSTSWLDNNYLKLDTSNDPLTGDLDLGANDLTTTGTLTSGGLAVTSGTAVLGTASSAVDFYIHNGGGIWMYEAGDNFLCSAVCKDGAAEWQFNDDVNIGTALAPENLTVYGSTTIGTLLGAVDAGGATSLEIPNAAGDVAVAAGQIAVDTAEKQLVWNDGTREIAISSIHIAQGTFDLAGWWDSGPATHEIWLADLPSDTYPNGVTILQITVDCSAADPVTEIDADLKSCDLVAGGAFPGGNQAVVAAIDTTTGNYDSGAITTAVATDKSLYILLNADPTDANTVYHVRIHYVVEED